MPSSKSGSPTSPSSPGFRSGVGPASAAPRTLHRWRVWLLAARPATLPAAAVPVIVGSAAAAGQGSFRLGALVAALISSLLIQIGTNFANDLFDYRKGADTTQRLGPVRATQAGLLSSRQVAAGTAIAFGLAVLIGLYLVYLGGWPILAIGLLGIAAGILYTGGPWPFGYHGLGDAFVFVFFGLVAVIGTYYLHAGAVDALALWASLPIGFLVTNILVVNNLRDIETDRAAGKRTLAVRLGAQATRVQYAMLAMGAYAVPAGLWATGAAPGAVCLPLVTLPLGAALVRRVLAGESGSALNGVLKRTGLLELGFGLLLAAGFLL